MKKIIILATLGVMAFAILGREDHDSAQAESNYITEVCQVSGRFVFRPDGEVYSFTEDHGERDMIVTFDTCGTEDPRDDSIIDAVAYLA